MFGASSKEDAPLFERDAGDRCSNTTVTDQEVLIMALHQAVETAGAGIVYVQVRNGPTCKEVSNSLF
jgi:hypothetical protein